MKKLIALFFVLASANVFAGPMPDVDSSWNEIQEDRRVIYRMPQYQLSHGWFMRAPSVCIEGNNLRSIKKVKECIRWSGGRNERCLEHELIYAKKALSGTRRTCTRWTGGRDERCVRWEDLPYQVKTSFDVKVYRKIRAGRDGDDYDRSSMYRPLFAKNYTIQHCE